MSTQYTSQQAGQPLTIVAPNVFFWPTILGCIMLIGLIAALVDDGGVVETIALILLGIPTVFMLYIYTIKHHINHSK